MSSTDYLDHAMQDAGLDTDLPGGTISATGSVNLDG